MRCIWSKSFRSQLWLQRWPREVSRDGWAAVLEWVGETFADWRAELGTGDPQVFPTYWLVEPQSSDELGRFCHAGILSKENRMPNLTYLESDKATTPVQADTLVQLYPNDGGGRC